MKRVTFVLVAVYLIRFKLKINSLILLKIVLVFIRMLISIVQDVRELKGKCLMILVIVEGHLEMRKSDYLKNLKLRRRTSSGILKISLLKPIWWI